MLYSCTYMATVGVKGLIIIITDQRSSTTTNTSGQTANVTLETGQKYKLLPSLSHTSINNLKSETQISKTGPYYRAYLKMIATSGFFTALECTKFVFGWGSAKDPAKGAYSVAFPQTH